MNVVLQILAHTQDFINYFASEAFYEVLNGHSMNDSQVTKEVGRLLNVISSHKFRRFSPHLLRTAVIARRPDFGGMCMHDAHEFLILLLEWLHHDLNVASAAAASPPSPPTDGLSDFQAAEAAWRQFRRAHDSIVTRLIHGLQKSTLMCTACGFESTTFETFSLLSLPLTAPTVDGCSLYHCLDQYVRGDPINDWTCPECQRQHDVDKKLDLWRLPQVLILHLKRFSFAGRTSRKSHVQVSFPLRDLDLGQLAIGPYPDTHSLVYDLYGVVEHHGSQHNGHYTAYCLNQPAATWFFLDDTAVREVSAGRVREAMAYLLCYSARNVI